MLTLYDAERCPYAARVRITLAEKGIPYEQYRASRVKRARPRG